MYTRREKQKVVRPKNNGFKAHLDEGVGVVDAPFPTPRRRRLVAFSAYPTALLLFGTDVEIFGGLPAAHVSPGATASAAAGAAAVWARLGRQGRRRARVRIRTGLRQRAGPHVL